MDFIQIQLLHWCHDENEIIRKVFVHDHPYWQLEFMVKGRIMIHDGVRMFQFTPGSFWLIPPQAPHAFLKENIHTESYSFKFAVADDEIMAGRQARILLPDNYLIGWIGKNLLELVRGETQGSLIAGKKKDTLEYLLLDILHYAHREIKQDEVMPEIIAQIREMVMALGKKVNVESVAASLDISVSRLKYLFAQAVKESSVTGGDTSVKKFIDLTCLELIENYLKYSDFSIGRIAETTGFPDIYALSRFYTRLRGYPPSHFKSV